MGTHRRAADRTVRRASAGAGPSTRDRAGGEIEVEQPAGRVPPRRGWHVVRGDLFAVQPDQVVLVVPAGLDLADEVERLQCRERRLGVGPGEGADRGGRVDVEVIAGVHPQHPEHPGGRRGQGL